MRRSRRRAAATCSRTAASPPPGTAPRCSRTPASARHTWAWHDGGASSSGPPLPRHGHALYGLVENRQAAVEADANVRVFAAVGARDRSGHDDDAVACGGFDVAGRVVEREASPEAQAAVGQG